MFGKHDENRQEELEGRGLSRRTFLTGGGVLAGAALLAGTGIGLTGCSSEDKDGAAEGTTPGAAASGANFDIFDTDVLIVGSGIAAMFAAFQANGKGAKVMMVEKGPYGFGGGCGMNWDQELAWPDVPPTEYTPGKGYGFSGLVNQKLDKNIFDFVGSTNEAVDQRYIWVRLGNTTWMREHDGSLENLMSNGTGYNLAQRGFSRHINDMLEGENVTIIDRTMITDLFVSEGTCVGALGIHLPTGRYRIFRAKATVTATGGTAQMYGWLRTHPFSMNTPDNTGELDAAAYRHGCSLISAEHFKLDLISVVPASLGASFNAGIGADGNHLQYVCDKDGNFFMREHVGYDISGPIRKAVIEGRGGEHGGVFIDLTSDDAVDEKKLRPCYARNIQLWKDQFGIDVRANGYKIPVALEAFEHAGNPMVDENLMTELPGLFSHRGSGVGAGTLGRGMTYGAYAGHRAAEFASGASIESVDWSGAVEEVERLEELLTREVDGGLRPHQVRHAIQAAFYSAHEPGKDAAGLQACIDEFERIKNEDLPKMIVTNKTRVYNNEWKQAIENYSILTIAEATARAGLMREETRETHFRTDFPEPDDTNWKCNVAAKLVDGQMAVEKVPVVTL